MAREGRGRPRRRLRQADGCLTRISAGESGSAGREQAGAGVEHVPAVAGGRHRGVLPRRTGVDPQSNRRRARCSTRYGNCETGRTAMRAYRDRRATAKGTARTIIAVDRARALLRMDEDWSASPRTASSCCRTPRPGGLLPLFDSAGPGASALDRGRRVLTSSPPIHTLRAAFRSRRRARCARCPNNGEYVFFDTPEKLVPAGRRTTRSTPISGTTVQTLAGRLGRNPRRRTSSATAPTRRRAPVQARRRRQRLHRHARASSPRSRPTTSATSTTPASANQNPPVSSRRREKPRTAKAAPANPARRCRRSRPRRP